MINKPVRWGIIGCGDVTEIKSGPAYQQTEGFELVGVTRRDLGKAKDYAKRHLIPKVFDNADDLIQSGDIDAVYIATPPDSHMMYALKVAKVGKPCCIEKPMALNYDECNRIVDAFKESKTPLFIAFYRRTLPRFLKVKTWLESGQIGDPRHVNWVLTKPPSELDLGQKMNWRTDIKVAPGGYFDDLASHGLDLFHYLFGPVKEAFGNSTNQQGLYSAPDAVTGSWLYHTGITGSGCWNFGAFSKIDKVEIFGSVGKISFSIFEENPLVLENIDGRKEIMIDHPKHVQLGHVDAMKRHLLENDFRHPSTGDSALHTSWIMDKILGNKNL